MFRNTREAELHLNGKPVGAVHIKGFSNSWGFGDFTPHESFSAYATLFGSWSLLIHGDDDTDRTSPEALEELKLAEEAIDSLDAELVSGEERVKIEQINIDGSLIEWKPR